MTEQPDSFALGHWQAIFVPPRSDSGAKVATIFERQFQDGSVRIVWLPTRQINLLLSDADGAEILSVVSCPLHNPSQHPAVFQASWSVPRQRLQVVVNGEMIASTDQSDHCLNSYVIPPKPEALNEDLTSANAKAARDRKHKLRGTHPIPGRRPGGKDYAFAALNAEVLQLNDLLSSVQNGKVYHLPGIAARLRLLLVQNRGKMGLLQICAAHAGEQLIVYTSTTPYTTRSPQRPTLFHLSLAVNPSRSPLCPTEIDIDLWLELIGAEINGRRFTNRAVIATIGNTIGSHLDPDLDPLVFLMMGVKSDIPQNGSDMLVQYITKVGVSILAVAEKLLRKR